MQKKRKSFELQNAEKLSDMQEGDQRKSFELQNAEQHISSELNTVRQQKLSVLEEVKQRLCEFRKPRTDNNTDT